MPRFILEGQRPCTIFLFFAFHLVLLGEHRRAVEKAIVKQHINQPTAVSDHFTLPAHSMDNIELVSSSRTHHLK